MTGKSIGGNPTLLYVTETTGGLVVVTGELSALGRVPGTQIDASVVTRLSNAAETSLTVLVLATVNTLSGAMLDATLADVTWSGALRMLGFLLTSILFSASIIALRNLSLKMSACSISSSRSSSTTNSRI